MTIRVGVVDDQPLVRAGFASIVAHTEDLELIGEAANGQEGVDLARSANPDVLLMDVRMPILDGIEATGIIANDPKCIDVKILVLTTFDLDEYVYSALRAGASGFLLKNTSPEDLIKAVRILASGDALLAPSVTRRLIERYSKPGAENTLDTTLLNQLTDRETEVLSLVAKGLTNAEVAERLYMSAATAKTHVGHILNKLNARDRSQLVVIAYESGLTRPGAN